MKLLGSALLECLRSKKNHKPQGKTPELAVFIDNGLHHPVLGQVMRPIIIKIDRLPAHRTHESEGAEEGPIGTPHVTARS